MKYPFTETDLLRGILNLQCAIGTTMGSYVADLQNGLSCEDKFKKVQNMQVILFALNNYNYNYYAPTSINCITIDQCAILLQKAKQMAQTCNCNTPTRPVTSPGFYY